MSVTTEKSLVDARGRLSHSSSILRAVSLACRIDNGQKVLAKSKTILKNDDSKKAIAAILGGSIGHYFREMASDASVNFHSLLDLIDATVISTPLPQVRFEFLGAAMKMGFMSERSTKDQRDMVKKILDDKGDLKSLYHPANPRFRRSPAASLLVNYLAGIELPLLAGQVIQTCSTFEDTYISLNQEKQWHVLRNKWANSKIEDR